MFFKNSLQRLKWESWEVCLNIASSTLCGDGGGGETHRGTWHAIKSRMD